MTKYWSDMVKRTQPYVPGEQINEEHILKLNTNENPYPPSPMVAKAIIQEMDKGLHYYPTPTVEKLRQTIAKQNGLTENQVFIGNGSDEVLAFSFMAFFKPSKRIQFPTVTYSFYPVYAKLFDIPYIEVPLNEDFTIQPEAFFNSEGGVILANPNAPTSIYAEIEHIELILQNNSENVVIIDEAYIDFATTSAMTLIEAYPNLVVVQTTSKSRSLAGLRVGYAMGNPSLIEALFRIKDSFNSYTIDRLAIAGALAAFEDENYFKETTSKIITTREVLVEKLKRIGFDILPSQTNFVFITHEKVTAVELYQELKKERILTRHFRDPVIQNHLRVTIGTDEQMHKLMDTIKQIIG